MPSTATLKDIDSRITEIDDLVFRGNTGQVPMTVEQRERLETEASELMTILAQGLNESGAGPYQTLYDVRQKVRSLGLIAAASARYVELHPEPQPELDALVTAACKEDAQQDQITEMCKTFGTIFVNLPSDAVPPVKKGFLSKLFQR